MEVQHLGIAWPPFFDLQPHKNVVLLYILLNRKIPQYHWIIDNDVKIIDAMRVIHAPTFHSTAVCLLCTYANPRTLTAGTNSYGNIYPISTRLCEVWPALLTQNQHKIFEAFPSPCMASTCRNYTYIQVSIWDGHTYQATKSVKCFVCILCSKAGIRLKHPAQSFCGESNSLCSP